MARRLSVEWYHGVQKENHPNLEASLFNAGFIQQQVLRLCDRWEEELDAQESKLTDYDTPSWAAKQAHRNGDRSRIRKIRELFSYTQEE